MNTEKKSTDMAAHKQLRLWPGVVIVLLQWLVRFGIPIVIPGDTTTQIGVFGGLLGGLAVIIWWVFFSRASVYERWGAILLMILAMFATAQIIDKSIATAMMGLMFTVYSIPVFSLALVVWAVASRHFSFRIRLATMVATIVAAFGFWALLRSDGMDGEAHFEFAWRWAETAEERLMAETDSKLLTIPPDSATMESGADWPGFRGANRDGIISGVRIETDWSNSPPVEMWRRSVGPGCSSFAVHGPLIYTQEQRGEYEMVTCYNLNNGKPVWRHSDSTRFWDSHAGAGPRSTPTLSKGRVYTLGATGILNVLDAYDGTVVWSRNAAQDTDVKLPGWGYAGSPLVVDSVVVIAISGELLGYDLVSGKKLWSGPDGGESYSSPHLLTIDGIRQIVFTNKAGAASYSPSDGRVLWNLPVPGNHIVQPAMISDREILVDMGDIKGMKRFEVRNESGEWTVKEIWMSAEMKLYFNDFIIHKGYAYGFDGPGITCIDINDGKRKWRGDRYRGFLLLLADQDILVVLSEKGELALVEANPDHFREISRIPAIRGRTWNHPILAGDVLVVRNNEEMAAFRLTLKGS